MSLSTVLAVAALLRRGLDKQAKDLSKGLEGINQSKAYWPAFSTAGSYTDRSSRPVPGVGNSIGSGWLDYVLSGHDEPEQSRVDALMLRHESAVPLKDNVRRRELLREFPEKAIISGPGYQTIGLNETKEMPELDETFGIPDSQIYRSTHPDPTPVPEASAGPGPNRAPVPETTGISGMLGRITGHPLFVPGAIAAGGLGAYGLYRWLNRKPEEKQAGFLDNVKFHMPRVRALDTAVGAGLGALGGAGTYAVRSMFTPADTPEEDKPSFLNSTLAGAGIGAGLGNFVGDRARRYLVNNVNPVAYNENGTGLKPRSWQQFVDTAILDKPSPDGRDPGWDSGSFLGQPRYEQFRRALGLPVDPAQAWFRDVGDQPYEPTATSGGIPGVYPTVELNPDKLKAVAGKNDNTDSLLSQIARAANSPDSTSGGVAMENLLSRHGVRHEGNQFTVEDLWDVAPSPEDSRRQSQYLREAVSSPASLRKPIEDYYTDQEKGWSAQMDPISGYHAGYGTETKAPSRWEFLRSLLSRQAVNALLPRGGVVVRQRFNIDPATHQATMQSSQ